MIKLLIKFWPIFIPIVLFGFWYIVFAKKRRARGDDVAMGALEMKLWNWTLLTSLILGLGCLLWVALSSQSNIDATYVPPKYENGKVVPGHMIKDKE